MRPKQLYVAIESGMADLDDPALKERIAGLKSTCDQAWANAEQTAAMHASAYPSGEDRLAGLGMLFDSSDVFKCVAKDVGVGDHQRG